MKKAIQHIKYFLFIAYYWGIRLAFFIVKDEISGEKKYDINTSGTDNLKSIEKKGIDTFHATIYMPASYHILQHVFSYISNQPKKHLLDIGCGKGRALCIAAPNGFSKISGIDFSETLCKNAEDNLALTKINNPTLQYNIINTDAKKYEIENDVDWIFMFNPFDEYMMDFAIKNIMSSIQKKSRKLNVIYVNPLYKNMFLQEGFTETYHYKKLTYLEVCILTYKA